MMQQLERGDVDGLMLHAVLRMGWGLDCRISWMLESFPWCVCVCVCGGGGGGALGGWGGGRELDKKGGT